MTRSERDLLRLVAITLSYILVRESMGTAERHELARILRRAQERSVQKKRRRKR